PSREKTDTHCVCKYVTEMSEGFIVMTTKNPDTHAKPVNLRIREDVRILIDRAARIRGKTRSDFMIDAAYRAAEETLLDHTLVKVDAESYRHYLDILDTPP